MVLVVGHAHPRLVKPINDVADVSTVWSIVEALAISLDLSDGCWIMGLNSCGLSKNDPGKPDSSPVPGAPPQPSPTGRREAGGRGLGAWRHHPVDGEILQRDLILNLLKESADPIVREHLSGAVPEPIFVKNLENVQGDERDVVLFSLAFSTNPETGQLPLNFGPLSQAGGERRLNVAIARARRQVVLFSSFDPSDIDLSRTLAVGTQHLRAYCEMAAAGADRLGDLATDRTERRSRIRDEVAAALRECGYEVRISHGLSDFTVDIAVRRPGVARWQVAVMLDGPEWSGRPTVADRDSAPGLLRSIMEWPEAVRFWLPAWIHDRSALLQRVDEAIAQASAAEEGGPEPAQDVAPAAETELPSPRTSEQIEQPRATDHVAIPPRTELVAAAPAAHVTGLAAAPAFGPPGPSAAREHHRGQPLRRVRADAARRPERPRPARHDQRVRGLVREALCEIIAAEGPIEQHRLARLALARFGFLRTREDRRIAVLALVDARRLYDHPTVGRYAWPEGTDPRTYRAYRVPQATSDRAFEEVPPEEVVNAFVHVLQEVARMEEGRLLRAGLERLGCRRRIEKIDKRWAYIAELRCIFGVDLVFRRGAALPSRYGLASIGIADRAPRGRRIHRHPRSTPPSRRIVHIDRSDTRTP